jgi:hypothetical protein
MTENKKSNSGFLSHRTQTGIAVGSAIGFLPAILITGFPLGTVWIAVGALLGGIVAGLTGKTKK